MLRLTPLVVAMGVLGCGLIDPDLIRVDLTLPRLDFRIDSADFALVASDGNTLPSVPCGSGCEGQTEELCTGTCDLFCDTPHATCAAMVNITLRNDFDLESTSEYQAVADQTSLEVTIDDVYFDITMNTLTIDTPRLAIYCAPMSVTSTDDDAAELIGTVEPVAHGQTGRTPIVFEPGGRDVLKRYLDDFHTPFRILVSGEVTVYAGQALPEGRLVGAVIAEAHVSLE